LRDFEGNQEIFEEDLSGVCRPAVLGKTHCYFLAIIKAQ
jgi:hypothetical protein